MFTQLVRRFAWCRQGNTSVFLTSSGLFACLEREDCYRKKTHGSFACVKQGKRHWCNRNSGRVLQFAADHRSLGEVAGVQKTDNGAVLLIGDGTWPWKINYCQASITLYALHG